MELSEPLRESDAAVVARYLVLRSHFHDRLLARLDTHLPARYHLRPSTRLQPTLVCLHRRGWVRPGEGELWPVVFFTPVDLTLALCVQIGTDRLAALGTTIDGPQRLRHRHWDDWMGWETNLAGVHPQFFTLAAAEQDDAMFNWYLTHLEWLANAALMRRR